MMKIVRHLLLCLSLLSLPVLIVAQNTLTIHQKDGQQFSFGFEEKPVVSFSETTLMLKTDRTEVQYPLSLINFFTFDERKPDALEGVEDSRQQPLVSLGSQFLRISGARADIPVRLTSVDGKVLRTARTDAGGSLTLSLADLPEGVYIVSSTSLTCKILKK